MPASGRGANLDTSRRVGTPRGVPTPPPPPPHRAPINLRSTALPSAPFRPAQQQAQKRVVQAQRALPPQPHPHIPYLAHPTPKQTAAALELVRQRVKQDVGPNPTAQHIAAYVRERELDPRNRQFLSTYRHYVNAAAGQLGSSEGRRVLSGNQTLNEPYKGPTGVLSASFVNALGKAQAPLTTPGRATAKAPPKDASLPLFGLANIKIPGSAAAASTLASVVPAGLKSATPEAAFLRNLLSDARDIGTLPLVGGYKLTEAGLQGAMGNFKPAKELGASTLTAVEHGALGSLVRGDMKSFEAAIREHPGFSVAEILGGAGIAGRAAGGLGRAAARPGGRLDNLVSRAGPATALSADNAAGRAIQGHVRYGDRSPDLIRSGIQQAAERIGPFKRDFVKDASGNPLMIPHPSGKPVKVRLPSKREEVRFQNKLADHRSASVVARSRDARSEAAHQFSTAMARTGRGPAVLRAAAKPLVSGRSRPIPFRHGVYDEASKSWKFGKSRAPTTLKHIASHIAVLRTGGELRSGRLLEGDLRDKVLEARQTIEAGGHRTTPELESAKQNLRILESAFRDPAHIETSPLHPGVAKLTERIVKQGENHAVRLNAADQVQFGSHVENRASGERARRLAYARAFMHARHHTEDMHKEAEAAEKALGASPRRLSEVSGRAPGLHEAHLLSKAERDRAKGKVKATGESVERLKGSLQRTKGAARRSEGGGPGRKAIRPEDRAKIAKREQALKRAEQAHTRAKATHAKAEKRLAKNPLPPRQEGTRHFDGRYLSNEEIDRHMREHGVHPDTVAYLPHRINEESARSHYRRFSPESRPIHRSEANTGAMQARNSRSFSPNLVRDELTRKMTLAPKALAFDTYVREAGQRHPEYAALKARAASGGKLTKEERKVVANEGYMNGKYGFELAARKNAEADAGKGGRVVAIRAFNADLSSTAKASIRDQQSVVNAEGKVIPYDEAVNKTLLNDRIVHEGEASLAHNVVLVPEHEFQRLVAQTKSGSELTKSVQMLNTLFRTAVLTQPKWLTGNFVEPFFVRLPLTGSGVILPGFAMDLHAWRTGLKRLEKGTAAQKEQAKMIRAYYAEGGLIGRKGAQTHRTWEDFKGIPRHILHGLHWLGSLPVIKQMKWLLLAIPKSVFALNRLFVEAPLQKAVWGKQLRHDVQTATSSWMRGVHLFGKALDDALAGRANTAGQLRAAEYLHEIYGKYDGWSPVVKKAVQSYTPFLPWTLNALRFVYWTVPAHHTVAFVGLTKIAEGIQKEWEDEHRNAPEGELKFDPRHAGGYAPLARFTPYAVSIPLSQQSPDYKQLLNNIAPQVSGLQHGLEGVDAFGKPLRVKPDATHPGGKTTGLDNTKIGLYNQFESMAPLISIVRRLHEGGGTGYSDSTILSPKVKPGTTGKQSAATKTLLPWRTIYPKGTGPGTGGKPETPKQVQDREVREELEQLKLETSGADTGNIDQEVREELELLRKGG